MITHGARATGIANISMDGTVLDTWFPHPDLMDFPEDAPAQTGTVRLGARDLSPKMLSLVKLDEDRMVEQVAVQTTIRDLSQPAIDAHDVYLRLHLLSHRLVKPHELNMDGVFDKLATVVWTNKGPCLPDNFEYVRTSLRSRGLIHVYAVDRLPRMVDYVVPSGVRIAEAERVRLGAYLAPGTTVRREGFVSLNSGTLGPAKVEGRLSFGVVVGEGCQIELSSSVLSHNVQPGQRKPITLGRDCYLGVSSGVIDLNLGDRCHIGNNVILEPDTPLHFAETGETAPARTIEGQSDWKVSLTPDHTMPVATRLAQ